MVTPVYVSPVFYCLCLDRKLSLRMDSWKLTGNLYCMPCCATPIHSACFWERIPEYPRCPQCDHPFDPPTYYEHELAHYGNTLDRLQICDILQVPRW